MHIGKRQESEVHLKFKAFAVDSSNFSTGHFWRGESRPPFEGGRGGEEDVDFAGGAEAAV
jgi:hypothetical protein